MLIYALLKCKALVAYNNKKNIIYFYYMNTNEIPSDLSHENMISSHVKITCYFHT